MQKRERMSMQQVIRSRKYLGKHVVVAGGEVYVTTDGDKVGNLIDKARKEHPRSVPEVYFMPKGTLIV